MKKVVFTFGRFNPPTIGHEKLIQAVEKEAGSADWLIIPSQTVDKQKNPLPYEYKVELLKKMFPQYAKHIDDGACCKTPIDVMKHLMMKEYTDVVMVVGSDRVGAMSFIQKYNRGDDYSFNTVEIANAGERDPDADGASGMSASKMRDAAKNQKTTEFLEGIPDTLSVKNKLELMAKVREGMGL